MTQETVPEVMPVSTPAASLSAVDKMALDLAKSKRQLAQAELATAQAKSESSELAFRYTILQIYRKYSLNDNDTINPDTGEITLGGVK